MDWIVVRGQSMRPLIEDGDEVAVEWLSRDRRVIRLGDVVLGRDVDSSWIVHRVVRADEKGILVKGDATFATDSFGEKEIWGKVVAIKKRGRLSPFKTGLLDRGIARLSLLATRCQGTGVLSAISRRASRTIAMLKLWVLG